MSLMPVCELWIPDAPGVFLRCAAGSYVGHEEFGDKSGDVAFAKGEGLPGRVWTSRQPEILTTLGAPSDFVRAKAAAATGLSAGVGLPILRGEHVAAVLTFLSAQSDKPTGMMEVWSPNADSSALTWRSGFYGALQDAQSESVATRFKLGEGLPGRAWKTRLPELVTTLSLVSDNFVRHKVAKAAGLTTGIAIPIMLGVQVQSIVTLLSTSEMPFGQVMEIWIPSDDDKVLERKEGYYGKFGKFHDDGTTQTFARGEGLPGQVWESAMPQLIAPLDEKSGFARYQSARSAELSVAIGIPIIDGGRVTAVILLLS
jgi:hypothetical protein